MPVKKTEDTPKYTKAQVVASAKYRPYRDIFGASLENGKEYTAAELEKIKNDFLKKPIIEKVNGKKG